MNSAVQVALIGKFQSYPRINTVSNTRVIPAASNAKRILFGAPEPGEIDKIYNIFNTDCKKYLRDRYIYMTSQDEKIVCTCRNCQRDNLIEIERSEYENKMKNMKITSKSY